MKHLDFQKAIEYLQKAVPTEEATRIDQHVSGCSQCQEEIEIAHSFLTTPQNLSTPAPNLLNRVTAAFKRKQDRLSKRPLRLANLEFDSWNIPSPLGVRGGSPEERQLLYIQDQYDLDVQITKDTNQDAYVIQGQLLDSQTIPTRLDGYEVQLVDPGIVLWRSMTDELGRFTFSYCPPGDYSLRVILDTQDLYLDSLQLQA